MANHRGVADWISLSFEHTADMFCCHGDPQTETPITKLTPIETIPDHPPTDKAVPPGNN